MEKVIRDGMVAVIYSPGFGAGWYSWNTEYEWLLFHPKLVEMVESGRREEIDNEWTKENFGIGDAEYIYCGGAKKLEIAWLPVGTKFIIDEYDGSESVTILDKIEFITA